ncbi:MAG: hypothetical protein BJBARM5_0661 [Candidatus Parvarchaeum acidophilus ARMAN-5]|jgi:hypothetical protein|uniref:Uncharacterized protein n=1 Tax=Candidatus Parvarchaeum acidophilus ARMAN-5 TaxID=662762 RepID=D6GVZ0_PARA5|nr:MAG: hypothetical protein BJBARM5_0946 [Candidatus Parvarchaeum acidophilus ARMAN-5]EFD92609.1 MAG: hypothetical protein BJBARM5_0661 [Candidatus Parvarchaeum acidophilus ARMAN-5]
MSLIYKIKIKRIYNHIKQTQANNNAIAKLKKTKKLKMLW